LTRAADASADEATGPLQEIVRDGDPSRGRLEQGADQRHRHDRGALDIRGVKDFQDVARFTPGVNIDNSGTTTSRFAASPRPAAPAPPAIYLDDTPIQIRALAFNPDEALPKSFDVERIEVLRGPQGTLFGAGSEGGTVRYITTQPSLTKSSIYSREEFSYTQGGSPNYEAGVAGGMPIIDGTLEFARAFGTGATAATSIALIR